MGYAVFHRDEAGAPVVEDVSSVEAAVELVERLRNEHDRGDVRVFREVPLKVRTYYKVVVADETDATVSSTPTAPNGAASDEPPAVARDKARPATAEPRRDPLPGAFPLAPATVDAPAAAKAEVATEDVAEAPRRASLFTRSV